MLKRIRVILATIVFALITLLFLDFTGTMHVWFSWLAKIQFLPAVLALNVIVVAVLVILTLLLGRIYCSVICPLGIMQDIIARLNRKKNRYSYSGEKRVLRYAVLVVFVVLLVVGLGAFATWGWTAYEGALGAASGTGNFLPLPHPQLARQKDSWRRASGSSSTTRTLQGITYPRWNQPSAELSLSAVSKCGRVPP